MSNKEVDNAIAKTVAQTEYSDISKKELKLQGSVKQRKKHLGDKFAETFLSEDISSVRGYVFTEIVIPAVKNLLYDIITNGSSMFIFGSLRNNKIGNGGYRDYNSISKTSSNHYRPVVNDNTRDRFDFRDLVFSTHRDAEEVLYTLYEYIHDYGHASVADYYDSIPGVSSVYTDRDWGWIDLSNVRVQAVRDGFVLTLPRPIYKPESRR